MNYKILSVLVFFVLTFFFLKYEYFNKSILDTNYHLYITADTSFAELIEEIDSLSEHMHPIAKVGLNLFIKQKRLDYWFRPGHYILDQSYSMNDIVNKLRSQSQDPVNIIFNSMDNISNVFGIIDDKLELDSIDLIQYLESIDLPLETLYFSFIPNTYEVFWDISAEEFINRMNLEYNVFWDSKNITAASKSNLSKHEVFILASIVDKEASHFDEMPRIAGLYLNRLKKRWPLESDPTVVYIWKKKFNQSLKRVYNKHIDSTKKSLFNTYHHKGLPPMPICVPSLQAINAVLFPEEHEYMFMCAKADHSEYHNFAKTYREHKKNANAFQKWLNQRKIY